MLAFVSLSLCSESHCVIEVEVGKLTFENLLGLSDNAIKFGIFWGDWVTIEHPLLLHLPDTEREAAVDDGDVLIISIENIICEPNWLPIGELESKSSLMVCWVVLLSFGLNTSSSSKCTVGLNWRLSIFDTEQSIRSCGYVLCGTLTSFTGLSLRSVELIPVSKILL